MTYVTFPLFYFWIQNVVEYENNGDNNSKHIEEVKKTETKKPYVVQKLTITLLEKNRLIYM